jgi:hypothetical protein
VNISVRTALYPNGGRRGIFKSLRHADQALDRKRVRMVRGKKKAQKSVPKKRNPKSAGS